MAECGQCFVEWKEEFVSKERGKRVVNYFLKEKSGESVLAVIGTERSIRHMFYVVAEEFLRVNELNRSVNAAYRWRSKREVVNWLNSMLSKQHQEDSPKGDHVSGVTGMYQSRTARNLKLRTLDIVWSGETWTCGKQLKHFPAFCRNGITIAVHSFVFVMAEGGKRHLAFLEDMYEDRKGQKKVKVRWFHHNQEVNNNSIILKNPHPKEVFVTPYIQVISVECVDGPAIVLTREHYDKCEFNLPEDLLTRIFICFRQFKNNRIKPFKLSKLRGYFSQPIFSFLDHGYDDDDDDGDNDDVKLGSKRSSRVILYDILRKKLIPKYAKNRHSDISCFKVNEKVELLCQDSGIRGCWFRCTVLRVGRRRIKVRYDDLIDEDGSSNLEEWVSSSRLAIPDKLGLRHSGRPTMRPAAVKQNEPDVGFEVGSAVDAWWSDGWWEGIVTEINASVEDANIQVYLPGESLFLNVHKKDVRVSRDWVGDRWVNIKGNPDARLLISDVATKVGPHNEIYKDDGVRMEVCD